MSRHGACCHRYTFSVRATTKPARGLVTGDCWIFRTSPAGEASYQLSGPLTVNWTGGLKAELLSEAPRPLLPDAKTVLPFRCGEGNETIREEYHGFKDLIAFCHPLRKPIIVIGIGLF